jgi:hypothetical protein
MLCFRLLELMAKRALRRQLVLADQAKTRSVEEIIWLEQSGRARRLMFGRAAMLMGIQDSLTGFMLATPCGGAVVVLDGRVRLSAVFLQIASGLRFEVILFPGDTNEWNTPAKRSSS